MRWFCGPDRDYLWDTLPLTISDEVKQEMLAVATQEGLMSVSLFGYSSPVVNEC